MNSWDRWCGWESEKEKERKTAQSRSRPAIKRRQEATNHHTREGTAKRRRRKAVGGGWGGCQNGHLDRRGREKRRGEPKRATAEPTIDTYHREATRRDGRYRDMTRKTDRRDGGQGVSQARPGLGGGTSVTVRRRAGDRDDGGPGAGGTGMSSSLADGTGPNESYVVPATHAQSSSLDLGMDTRPGYYRPADPPLRWMAASPLLPHLPLG